MGFLVVVASAYARRELQPGTSFIRVTSQVIKRDKKGPIRFSASAIYNKYRSPYAIGNSVSRCVMIPSRRTVPKGAQICTVVYRFPLGQIVASGFVASPVYYTIAVTGGTGLYNNVGGSVQAITTKLAPRKEKLIFKLIAIKETP